MDSLFILIPIALVFTGLAVAAFFWAVHSGQYEDLDRASRDILFDDEDPAGSPSMKSGDDRANQEEHRND
jgi:cbb3-type cytochrome oxidase maturation protein